MKTGLTLLLISTAAVVASVPRFAAPFVLQANSDDLSIGQIADPFFVDLNGDGMSDMVAGWPEDGYKVRFYRYSWSNQDPQAASFSFLPSVEAASFIAQAHRSDLKVGLIANPYMVDWNGDGLKDLIVGQFIDGRVRFYPNSGTNREPAFTTFSYLRSERGDITTTFS
jgi:hypothetical protein